MSDHLFIRACFREPVERTPVWLMRQAGRYMAEYHEFREKYTFLEMCKKPKVAAEITLQPVRALGVDAAILFSDILVPVEAMGMKVDFMENLGPKLHKPVRTPEDVEALEIPEPEEKMPFVLEAIKLIKEKLSGELPLIGFSGAPFTLASYMIEGGGSRDFRYTKEMMFSQPETFAFLMKKIGRTVVKYLNAQIKAGVDAIQIFDSWVGCLAPEDYSEHVINHTSEIISGLNGKGEVPVIQFVNQASTFLELASKAGGDVIGIDWRITLDEAWEKIGYDKSIQGNLDPVVLFAPQYMIESKVRGILEQAGGRDGHIFNLGHGVHRDTPVENVKIMVKTVKEFSKRM